MLTTSLEKKRMRMMTRRQLVGEGSAFAMMMLIPRVSLAARIPSEQEAFAAIEAKTSGRLGVMLTEVKSGRCVGYRADERFPMCSTVKVLVCGAVLSKVDRGEERFDRRIHFTADQLQTYSPATKAHLEDGMTVGDLCEAAITLSDNTAMNLLTASVGGPAGVTAFARTLGDVVTRLDRIETTLNEAMPGDPRDTSTPNAMASTLAKLALGPTLSNASRESLNRWMIANTTGNAKLRAGVTKSWKVGDKTGTGGHGTSNDIGVFWREGQSPICAVVYLTGAENISEQERAAASAAVGRLASGLFL